MAETNTRVVREFLEASDFIVITNRKFQLQKAEPPGRYSIDLLGRNMQCAERESPLPMRLRAEHMRYIPNVIVGVKGWHSQKFSASLVDSMKELYYFVSPAALEYAREAFDGAPFKSVLVISEAPSDEDARLKMEEILGERGVDHVLEFPTILNFLISHVEVSVNYVGSDVLQLLRYLKRYGLVKGLQMDLPFKRKAETRESRE
jgi:hypothetical protein